MRPSLSPLAFAALCSCVSPDQAAAVPWAVLDLSSPADPVPEASPPTDRIGEAPQPFLNGPCANSCAALISGICDWQAQCSDVGVAECGERFVPCLAAEEIAELDATLYAMELCWRMCEGKPGG